MRSFSTTRGWISVGGLVSVLGETISGSSVNSSMVWTSSDGSSSIGISSVNSTSIGTSVPTVEYTNRGVVLDSSGIGDSVSLILFGECGKKSFKTKKRMEGKSI